MDTLISDITNLVSQYLVHSERQLLRIKFQETDAILSSFSQNYVNGFETLGELFRIVDKFNFILTGNTIRALYYKYLRQDTDISHIKLEFDIIAHNRDELIVCSQLFINRGLDIDYELNNRTYPGDICVHLTLHGVLKNNFVVLNIFTIESSNDVLLDDYMLTINKIYILEYKMFQHPEVMNATLNRDLVSLGVKSHHICDLFDYQLLQMESVNNTTIAYYKQLCGECKIKYKNSKYSSSDFKKFRCLKCAKFEYCDNLLSKINCNEDQVYSKMLTFLMQDQLLKDYEKVFKDTENPFDRKSYIENDCETIRRRILRIKMQYAEMYEHD